MPVTPKLIFHLAVFAFVAVASVLLHSSLVILLLVDTIVEVERHRCGAPAAFTILPEVIAPRFATMLTAAEDIADI